MRIVLAGVGVRYDQGMPASTTALDGVDLSIEQGERVAVIGPSGSGKTTLLEVMSGLSAPTTGRAFLEPAGNGRSLRDAVGLAYQFPELQFFEETVFADVAFGPVRQKIPATEIPARVRDALARAGLSPDDFAQRSPLSLSAGEKRRAAIAGILALGRPFLLLDEPTAGLDPSTAERVERLIVAEAGSGVGVVFVTHDLELVERSATRIVVLLNGGVLADRPGASALADGELLRMVGLEPPPACVLIERLKAARWPDAERVAALLASGRFRC
ncbi:MAG: ATP-binding cassette domain-containing protein [Candidatus Eisenbacteria bacterium]|nr:ATP-binding cassette domain-containing protein [Candidatus Eisenbacteria bacterium]